jgi:general secretion pathway protein D
MIGLTKQYLITILIFGLMSFAFAQDNGINLSFNNADIDSVVSVISRATNQSIIVDPKVKGKISLNSKQSLTPTQTIDALATALRLNGFALVETPSGFRVVTEADAKLQSSQTYTSRTNASGDQIITRVFKLNFESATNVVNLIRPLVSPNNTINALPGNNSILITDYASNISRIEKIIQNVDSPNNTKVETIPLKNAQAVEVANIINKVLDNSSTQGADQLSKPSVTADPRSNVLLIRGGSPERFMQIQSLVSKLDVSKNSGNLWVIPLKNAEATKLAITLRAIMVADSSFGNVNTNGNPGVANSPSPIPVIPNQLTAPVSNTNNNNNNLNQLGGGPSAAATSSLVSSSAPSTGGMIQADPTTNSLIITASEPVYKNLLRVVEQLDRRRAQIYIEAMIIELTSANAAELGIQWQGIIGSNNAFAGTNFNGPASSGTTNIIGSSAAINGVIGNSTINANVPVPGVGLNIGTIAQFGSNLGLSTLLRAVSTVSGTKVLSAPNLMTLDNEEARIVVGQNVPILTGSYSQTGTTATVTPFQTYSRQDVGITLRVRPQISENGTVKLQIFQEVSSIQDATNASGIILNKRNIESNVIVNDGQIIVLGGLIGDNYSDASSKIPLLGDIPLIGSLFRYDNKSRSKTNLMVFMRPYVLRNDNQSNDFTNKKIDQIEEKNNSFVQAPMLLQKEDLNNPSIKEPITTPMDK